MDGDEMVCSNIERIEKLSGALIEANAGVLRYEALRFERHPMACLPDDSERREPMLALMESVRNMEWARVRFANGRILSIMRKLRSTGAAQDFWTYRCSDGDGPLWQEIVTHDTSAGVQAEMDAVAAKKPIARRRAQWVW